MLNSCADYKFALQNKLMPLPYYKYELYHMLLHFKYSYIRCLVMNQLLLVVSDRSTCVRKVQTICRIKSFQLKGLYVTEQTMY